MDYDRTNIPEAYKRSRHHGPAFLQQWMDVVARVAPAEVRDILDLGCGTGRFSESLATRFDANLIGIDPSMKMLSQAAEGRTTPRVNFVMGLAESIPLRANSVDVVFVSMVFHHFRNPQAVAEECRRVLRHGGRVCLRTASIDQIELYAYVPFFPASRPLLEQRLPRLAFQREVFEAAAFQTISYEVVTQEIAPDLSAYADKLAAKGDSIIASLDDDDFEAGMHAVRHAAASSESRPVSEPIDFFVFVKS